MSAVDDLVDRLRFHVRSRLTGPDPILKNGAWQMMLDAADEIEQLRKAEHDAFNRGVEWLGEQAGKMLADG